MFVYGGLIMTQQSVIKNDHIPVLYWMPWALKRKENFSVKVTERETESQRKRCTKLKSREIRQ